MNTRIIHPVLLTFASLVAGCFALASEPVGVDGATILSRLRTQHPRLLASAADFEKLKKTTAEGEAAKWLAKLRGNADALLKAAPSKYEIPDGKRLLTTSRRVLDRTLTLGLVFRLRGDRRHAQRLCTELEAAARFKDWNPSHFLDTAEMTAAFAIGYDWLFDTWTPQQRRVLRTAIVELGLKQSLPLYRQQKWWTVANHNWNQVCNGGMTLGALALADEERELAGEILPAAIASVRRLTATLLSPPGAVFELLPAEPLATSPQPERQQVKRSPVKKPRKLAIHLRAAASPRIAVLLSPEEKPATPARLALLAEWK